MSRSPEEAVRALGELVGSELSGEAGEILVLRHSIREPIRSPDLAEAMAAPLTEEGRALSAVLAQALPVAVPITVRHSPVPRCEETARILADVLARRGARVHLAGALEALGAIYVRDPDRVVERFASLGQRGFVRAWSSGALPDSLIDPARVAGERLLAQLLELRGLARSARGQAGPGLDLHVTHDLTLVALLSRVAAIDAEDFPWPAYLGGVLLIPRDDALRWRYGASVYETSLPE